MLLARSFVRLVLLAFVALLAPVGVLSAGAAPPTSSSGAFTTTSATFNSTRIAGGNRIIDLTAHVTYTGTFVGTSLVQGTLIFHPDGSANFHDIETFTGTVNGVPGTVTFNLNGGSTPDGVYHGTDVVTSGSGGLATLHGVMTQVGMVQPPQGPFGTYTAQLLTAPQ